MMKQRFLILSLLIFILSGCDANLTDQQKVENAIKKHLKDTLDDPSSYESVEFGEAEPEYKFFRDSSIENWEIAKNNDEMYSKLADWKRRKEYKYLYDTNIKQAEDSILHYQKLHNEAEKTYYKAIKEYEESDREQIGWRISHTFRANNQFGAKIKQRFIFLLDTNLLVERSWKPMDQG